MSLDDAFKSLIALHSREMVLQKADYSLEITIKVSVSNYFRNLAAQEETVVEGQEFILVKDQLSTFGTPKRGDRLIDPEFGEMVMSEIRPMLTLGAAVIGYRIRTS